MSPTNAVRLCEKSSKLEQDWRDLYTAAFPVSEQESEAKLQNLIDNGKLLYHKTVGKNGELLCFSMVSLAPDFSFLAYIATDPRQRSGGYGSKHMRALIDLLKNQYPTHVGLFLEIESTNPRNQTLSDEDKNTRKRRLDFYRRLGSKRLCRSMQYLAPSKSGQSELELDILFFNFANATLEHKAKERIVSEIYQRFYELPPSDPLVTKVLSKVTSCGHPKCEEEPADSSTATATTDKTAALPAASPTVPTSQAEEAKQEQAPAADMTSPEAKQAEGEAT